MLEKKFQHTVTVVNVMKCYYYEQPQARVYYIINSFYKYKQEWIVSNVTS